MTFGLSHKDVCTHYDNPEDRDVLTRRSFDVNMRLLKTSMDYYFIIEDVCNYIEWSAKTLKEGYPQPKGWSGPNAGIPFNIIYVPPYGIMINPIWDSNNTDNSEVVYSNCGSLTLLKPKAVVRALSINVKWWDLEGHAHTATLDKEHGGYTFQHEFLHCRGELI